MNLFRRALFFLPVPLLLCALSAGAQDSVAPSPHLYGPPPPPSFSSSRQLLVSALGSGNAALAEPAAAPKNDEEPVEPSQTNFYQAPFSRMGIGADISPLGVGIKSAIVLNTVFDARLMGNFFNYSTGRVEVDNINIDSQLHLASLEALFDWYPWRSVWRFSIGTMLYNGNEISADTRLVSGESIKLNGQTFYSANTNPVTGSTPLTGSGTMGMHRYEPELILSGGFGRFIPRSERHWSFPTEFGVVFMGAPTVDAKAGGWVCQDAALTQCSNLADPTNPITTEFNNALQAQLVKWRKSVSSFSVYPIFSYSVVYSFNLP